MDEKSLNDAQNAQFERPEGDSSSKIRAQEQAQRQLVACLLRNNDLFHKAMPDGADFCEAVPPGDVAGEGSRVYQLLHDRFADGESLTLLGLLAELAERGWDNERRWLTRADVELDPLIGDDAAKLDRLFDESAQAIMKHQRRQAFEQDRRSLVANGEQPNDPVAAALELAGHAQRLAQQRRDEQDPGRIARGSN